MTYPRNLSVVGLNQGLGFWWQKVSFLRLFLSGWAQLALYLQFECAEADLSYLSYP